ncbi:PEP-CTERM sorting domain-containing protein [Albibacillus kandeliae]|uniref:PEP-CTERM sorting domain-containing protein n=1 Tax=Albibacillus kandeliae TaxID=2174228 RepID=UPI000D69F397|nr:PEP-CTERM sorting domain-containing protein [Albibacillus kandeliae]
MKKTLAISGALLLALSAPALAGGGGHGSHQSGGSQPSGYFKPDYQRPSYDKPQYGDEDCDPSVVPLPASLPLAAGGFALMGFIGRRRKKS